MSAFVITLCGIALVVLFLGGFLAMSGFRDAPEEPQSQELEDRIQHGQDGTTDNGTGSRR